MPAEDLPPELIEELSSLEHYAFDFLSTYLTSYGSWHITGTHFTVTKTPILARVSPSDKALRLEQEFAIVRHMQRLDPSSSKFIRAYEFYKCKNSQAVVSIFEYLGENSLNEFASLNDSGENYDNKQEEEYTISSSRIGLTSFLDFALGAVECLELMHQSHNIVHGEIHEDAFYYNKESRVVKITQFGSTTRSANNSFVNGAVVDIIENPALYFRLNYMSPEQTGRTSTSVDHRTDIYSLGIVFYSILTKRLPFTGSSMEILQAILHSPVPSIDAVRPDIPPIIDAIIQKMTNKQVSDRYKSASGLRHDLFEVRNQMIEYDGATIKDFPLGQNDISSVFVLPTDMVGREAERDQVLAIIRKFARRRLGGQSAVGTTGETESWSFGLSVDGQLSDTLSSASAKSATSVDLTSWYASSRHDSLLPVPGRRERSRKKPEIIIIKGDAGVGKSTFISSLQVPSRKSGYFGKVVFREKTCCPFEPFVNIISILLKQVLSEKGDTVLLFYSQYKTKMGVLWRNIHRFLDHIPELQKILDIDRVHGRKPDSFFNQTSLDEETSSIASSITNPFDGLDGFTIPDNASQSSRSSGPSIRMRRASLNHENSFVELPVMKNFAGNKLLFASFLLTTFKVLADLWMVTIVIGDIQRADEESVELLSNLIHSKIDMVIILTHREGDKLPQAYADFVESDYSRLSKVFLKPLSKLAFQEYIVRTLHRPAEEVQDLVDFLYERFKGNPYYLKELLSWLYRKGSIKFDFRLSKWLYDDIPILQTIYKEFAASTDVDENFVIRRLKEFPKRARNFLIWAAFLGSPFSFALVRKFMNMPEGLSSSDSSDDPALENKSIDVFEADDKALSSLQTLLQAGLISSTNVHDEFRFSHDRYSQAALKLVRPENVATMNLLIAQVIMKEPAHDSYVVCEHLVEALPLIRDKEYRAPYRKEFANAAKQATESGSVLKAIGLYQLAISLLQEDYWNSEALDVDYTETFDLHVHLGEAYFWNGQADDALKILEKTFKHADTVRRKGDCYGLYNRIYCLKGEYKKVVSELRSQIDTLGIRDRIKIDEFSFHDTFWEFYKHIDNSTDDELLNVAPVTEEVLGVAETFLAEAVLAAYLGAPEIFFRATLVNFNMQINMGANDYIAISYIYLGMIAITKFRLFQFADRIRQISFKFIEKSNCSSSIARATYAYFSYLDHFSNHISNALSHTQTAMNHAVSSGDRVAMLQLQSMSVRVKFLTGFNLSKLLEECENILDQTNNEYAFSDGVITVLSVQQVVKSLMGRTYGHDDRAKSKLDPDLLLSDASHNSKQYREKLIKESFVASISTYLEYSMVGLFFFGHYRKVLDIASQILWDDQEKYSCTRSTQFSRYTLSLSMLILLRKEVTSPAEREVILARIYEQQESFKQWSSISDVNYYALWGTVDMMLEDYNGHYAKAMARYETVLDHCEKHKFILEKAVLMWLAGDMCLRHHVKSVGINLLKQASQIFGEWGAIAVVEEISKEYLQGVVPQVPTNYVSTGTQTVPTLPSTTSTVPLQDNEFNGFGGFSHPTLPPLHTADENSWDKAAEKALNAEVTNRDSATLDILDLQSIIKSGQIISSEINVDILLRKMTEIFINTTRAEISAIVVHEDKNYRVAAMGTVDLIETFQAPQLTLEAAENKICSAAVSYALNTGESVFLTNSAEDDRFSGTSWEWQSRNPEGRSMLVYPVKHKNVILGALYLEGAVHCFSTRHIEVLSLLSQQMGISITNAMLFKNVRRATMANAMMIESQKAALRQARESEARFVATLETMPCIIWTSDPTENGSGSPTLDYLNQFWYKFCGADAPGPHKDAYLEQLHPDDREKFTSALKNASNGDFETVEIRLRDAEGHYRFHICRGTALKNDEGEIIKWIGTMNDIDDQRQAREDALNAVRLKEEASKMKSAFLANMSHEIRTPIAGVIGMGDLLLGTDLSPEQRSFADNIRLCADALLTVITDVLDFSKIEVGKLELYDMPFDITKTLRETLSILSFPAAKKGLRLLDDIHFSHDMPILIGDPGRFRQVAMNLLTNAVKFTKSGNITLSARDGYEDDNFIEIRVAISDTGIGISKQVLSKLFLPFHQGDNSTARQFGGTGLGLSISKNLVELMHGSIGLESEYGKGTVAHFSVPLRKASPDANLSETYVPELLSPVVPWDSSPPSYPEFHLAPQATSLSQPIMPSEAPGETVMNVKPRFVKRTSTSSSVRSTSSVSTVMTAVTTTTTVAGTPPVVEATTGEICILVVEDNLINQQIALNLLKKLKYSAEAVGNGQEALVALDKRLASGKPYNLVLMDCQMPLMDGYEATRRLRQNTHDKIRTVPVVAMTANAVSGDRELCLNAGMSDYLAKPVKSKLLETMIDKWLSAGSHPQLII
ncbi:hypothetical protein V1514DRAFT_353836 [Lipomyces japonicus]|uniref:uncharacterized protein n=1 Tax=Lipomyces japonicus TaxID=56871 RepID=UPI0034CE6B8F